MSMPFAARLRRLSWYAAIHRSRNGPPRLMSSCTGTLSTTDQLRPDASTSSLRSAIASAVHGSPLGTSCRAVTTPVAPVCLMSARVIGSFGPYHRHVCSIQCLLSPSRLSNACKAIQTACTTIAIIPGHGVPGARAKPATPGTTRSRLPELPRLGADRRHHRVVGRQLGIPRIEHEAHRVRKRSRSEREELRSASVGHLGAAAAQVAHPGGDGSDDADGKSPSRALPKERRQDTDRQLLRAVPGDLVEPVLQ